MDQTERILNFRPGLNLIFSIYMYYIYLAVIVPNGQEMSSLCRFTIIGSLKASSFTILCSLPEPIFCNKIYFLFMLSALRKFSVRKNKKKKETKF